MSFGDKVYQHRFFTVPKIRNRHVPQFFNNQQSSYNQKFRSFSSFDPTFSPQIMKNSYIKLVQNGIKSRLIAKDEVGYQGLKFQNDIINRYCQNDYKKDSQMLQRFRKQAEQKRKISKFHHIKKNTLSQINKFSPQQINYNQKYINNQNIFQAQNAYTKNLVSFIPVTYSPQTNKNSYRQNIQNPDNIFINPKLTYNYPNNQSHRFNHRNKQHNLPQLKASPYNLANQNTIKSNYLYEEQNLNNQQLHLQNNQQINQFLQEQPLNKISNREISHRNSQLQSNNRNSKLSDNYRNNNQQNSQRTKKIIQGENKVKFLKLESLKSKNKFLKKKYDKIKKKLMQKSLILSHHQKIQQQRQQIQANRNFDKKINDLSQMIDNIGSRLKQDHQQTIRNISVKIKNNEQTTRQSQNQTQINLLNTQRFQNISATKSNHDIIKTKIKPYKNENEQDQYQKYDIKKIDYQKLKPKIMYTFQKNNKKSNYDPLKLIKNRMKQKFYLQSLGNYSSKSNNSSQFNKNNFSNKKQQTQKQHKRNKTQPI